MPKKARRATHFVFIAGARPNFMKITPLMKEMSKHAGLKARLVHTGQHYDYAMSKVFFEDFDLPKPDIQLGVGSGSHAEQTAKIMMTLEKYLLKEKPDIVVVVGDVNSTLAASLTAAKLRIPVAHVEAGLRSFDKTMPEEINRIVADSLSDYLFVTEPSAVANLRNEGVPNRKIFFTGNVIIDNLVSNREKALRSSILRRLELLEGPEGAPKPFALLTLHRPSNVDVKEVFLKILSAIQELQKRIQIVFPAHPRTVKMLKQFSLDRAIKNMANFKIISSQGYLDFLSLVLNSKLVLTDSGTIQEETTYLRIPCLTLRHNTERPITVEEGTNLLVGTDSHRIVAEGLKVLRGHGKQGRIPRHWDGHAAKRTVAILMEAYV